MQDNASRVSKLKIGLFITKGVWGGAQKYVYNLATSLSREKYDVFVVTGSGNILKEKLEARGVKTYVIENMKRDISIVAEVKSLLALFKIVWKEKPKILHLNSPKAAGLGSFVGRVLFVPKIIQTVHGFTWNEDRGAVSKVLIVFFTWLTLIFSHKNIVLGKREERQAKSLPFVKNKVFLIPNGVEKIEYTERIIARNHLLLRGAFEKADDKIWLVTVAELNINKGIIYTLEALKKLSTPFHFFVIGDGEEKEEIQRFIKTNNLEEKVTMLFFVSDIAKFLKAFDIFILSSIKEGLPYAILEAGQASLPVISTSVGGIPDIIENGKSGILVSPKKSGEITRALEYLIENPDLQKTFGENLEKKVESEFSIEKMLEKTQELYSF